MVMAVEGGDREAELRMVEGRSANAIAPAALRYATGMGSRPGSLGQRHAGAYTHTREAVLTHTGGQVEYV